MLCEMSDIQIDDVSHRNRVVFLIGEGSEGCPPLLGCMAFELSVWGVEWIEWMNMWSYYDSSYSSCLAAAFFFASAATAISLWLWIFFLNRYIFNTSTRELQHMPLPTRKKHHRLRQSGAVIKQRYTWDTSCKLKYLISRLRLLRMSNCQTHLLGIMR